MAEWIVGILGHYFACSSQNDAGRTWDDVKAELTRRGLTSGLQTELADVATYFKVRNLAAHKGMIAIPAGEEPGIIRFSFSAAAGPKAEGIRIEQLEIEAAQARKGYEAVQAVARALDDLDPEPLSGLNTIMALMVLGAT